MHQKDWHKADMSVHGTSGPLHIEPHDLAPISKRVKESMMDFGLPYHPDMFSTGETPHGCGDVPRTVHQGIRSTAADFITKGEKKANITIKTEVVVDKILFSDQASESTATGVSTISKAGKKIDYQARKEVIVTAGAYCSPAILMRSGLGPKAELQKHGIECKVDLPGVGQNLQDHCVRTRNKGIPPPPDATTNPAVSLSLSSTKSRNRNSQTTTLPTTITPSRRPTNSTRRRKQASSAHSPSVQSHAFSPSLPSNTIPQASSPTPVSMTASKTPPSGPPPRASKAATLWASFPRNPTSSSGTPNSTAGPSNTKTSPLMGSTPSPCATYSSTSGAAAA